MNLRRACCRATLLAYSPSQPRWLACNPFSSRLQHLSCLAFPVCLLVCVCVSLSLSPFTRCLSLTLACSYMARRQALRQVKHLKRLGETDWDVSANETPSTASRNDAGGRFKLSLRLRTERLPNRGNEGREFRI